MLVSRNQEIEKIQEVFDQNFKLISLYKRYDLTIPFSLKGNLGEFIVAMELLRRLPPRITVNFMYDYPNQYPREYSNPIEMRINA